MAEKTTTTWWRLDKPVEHWRTARITTMECVRHSKKSVWEAPQEGCGFPQRHPRNSPEVAYFDNETQAACVGLGLLEDNVTKCRELLGGATKDVERFTIKHKEVLPHE